MSELPTVYVAGSGRGKALDVVGRALEAAGFRVRAAEPSGPPQRTPPERPAVVILEADEYARLVENLRRGTRAEEDEERRRDEVLARLARGLRDPLEALRAACEALAELGAPDAVEARLRGIIGRQLGAISHLVDVLLDGVGHTILESDQVGSTSGEWSKIPVPPEQQRRQRPGGAKLRILLIEDHKDAREGMRLLLELWGHKVDVAADGERGVELARSRVPDVALVDVGLPRMDGFEVARALRGGPFPISTRLIALTGYARPQDRRRALESGFDAYLSKPVDPTLLARVLAENAPAPA